MLAIGIPHVCAQSTQGPPRPLFQFSTISGADNVITATRVPVVTGTGAIVYKNVIVRFEAAADGSLTIAEGYPEYVDPPSPLVSSFRAGNYVAPRNIVSGQGFITVAGPGVADGGNTQWSISTGTNSNQFTYPSTATFYTGSIDSNPLAERIKKAGLTSTAWSYGFGGTAGVRNWAPNSLLGFSQIGNTITVASFTDATLVDKSLPVDQVTFTIVQ